VKTCPAVLCLAAVLSLESVVSAAEFRIVGTDLLVVGVSKAHGGFAGRNRLNVALAVGDSRPGLDPLQAGRADLALAVLPPGALAVHGATTATVRVGGP